MLPPSIVRSEEACHVEKLVGDGERPACRICAGICRGPGDSWLLEVSSKETDAAAGPSGPLAQEVEGRAVGELTTDLVEPLFATRRREGRSNLLTTKSLKPLLGFLSSRRHTRTTDG